MAHATREAVRMNNLGAEAFANGELASALAAFRTALSLIAVHEALMEDQGVLQGAPSEATSLGISFRDSTYERSLRDDDKDDGPGMFVYCKPLVFNETIPETQDGMASLCAVLIFNMALTCDMRPKTANGVSKTKALALYESSLDLFSKTSSRVDLTACMAAACNNKTSIYYERGDFESSSQELQRLSSCLSQAVQSPTKTELMDDDDFKGMVLNLLSLRAPIMALAA